MCNVHAFEYYYNLLNFKKTDESTLTKIIYNTKIISHNIVYMYIVFSHINVKLIFFNLLKLILYLRVDLVLFHYVTH